MTTIFYLCSLIWMELMYHYASYGQSMLSIGLTVLLCLMYAGLASLCTGLTHRPRINRFLHWLFATAAYAVFLVQTVYTSIFESPLLIGIIEGNAGNALSEYWREALTALGRTSGWVILEALPLIALGVLLHTGVLNVTGQSYKQRFICENITILGFVCFIAFVSIGYKRLDGVTQYVEFYNREGVIGRFGIVPGMTRDIFAAAFPEDTESTDIDALDMEPAREPISDTEFNAVLGEDIYQSGTAVSPPEANADDEASTPSEQEVVEPQPVIAMPQILPIDFNQIISGDAPKQVKELAETASNRVPTYTNEYTGIFQGKNLVYITAESFSPYVVDKERTPTLYHLIHDGFDFTNYYVPHWLTSTSDGEYTALTGLVPDGSNSLIRSRNNTMTFSLPRFFAKEDGTRSYAFHNGTMTYYQRYLTHPNLGFRFWGAATGKAGTWTVYVNTEDPSNGPLGDEIFKMDLVRGKAQSDEAMVEATVPYYLYDDRFFTYYLTLSGHMGYNFTDNRMSKKHQDEVADLPYSNEVRAYLACNLELEDMVRELMDELDNAGKLDDTVFVLSADHYPYGLTAEHMNELAGAEVSGTLMCHRNNLVIYSTSMSEPVIVDKPCSPIDILPTLCNLFGFRYDSRLYAGKDILSNSKPLVMFSDRSFITDRVTYDASTGEVTWADDIEPDKNYLEAARSTVKAMFSYSAGILKNDFYRYVEAALPEEYQYSPDTEWTRYAMNKGFSSEMISQEAAEKAAKQAAEEAQEGEAVLPQTDTALPEAIPVQPQTDTVQP